MVSSPAVRGGCHQGTEGYGDPTAPSGQSLPSAPLCPQTPGSRSPSLPGCLKAMALARSPPCTVTPGPWWPCGCQGCPGGM